MKPERRVKNLLMQAVLEPQDRVIRSSPQIFSEWTSLTVAVKEFGGYNWDTNLQRITSTTRAVQSVKYTVQRDSVLSNDRFQHSEIAIPLLRHSPRPNWKVVVINLGRALRSTCRKWLPFLPKFTELNWNFVEPVKFPTIWRLEAELVPLYLHKDGATSLSHWTDQLLLSSGVTLHPSKRTGFTAARLQINIATLLLDETAVHPSNGDDNCIHPGPCQIFDNSNPNLSLLVTDLLNRSYNLLKLLPKFDYPQGSHPLFQGLQLQFKHLILESLAP